MTWSGSPQFSNPCSREAQLENVKGNGKAGGEEITTPTECTKTNPYKGGRFKGENQVV